MTQRDMHLSPAALNAAIRLLDELGPDGGFGDALLNDLGWLANRSARAKQAREGWR